MTYTLAQREVRDCHAISPISKEFQSILFLISFDKATERKQKWLKLQDNMCQLLPVWPQTALPSKGKKLPHGKSSQKWCKKKWHGNYFKVIGIPLIHIGSIAKQSGVKPNTMGALRYDVLVLAEVESIFFTENHL